VTRSGTIGLVIFDGDGVLYDTEPVVCRVQADVITALGHPITDADARTHIGKTGAEFYAAMAERFAMTIPSDINQRFVKRYTEILAEGLETIPGVRELIAGLTVPYCLATNSTRLRLDVTLKATGLTDVFEGRAFCLDDVARGKPAPDLFLLAAKTMGVAPADCLVIDDNIAGITAARAAGMRAVGFVGASHNAPGQADTLIAAGAERVCATMDEFGALLGISDTVFR
jgi:HAD superfamily hydrolase (TIGR01509 family)